MLGRRKVFGLILVLSIMLGVVGSADESRAFQAAQSSYIDANGEVPKGASGTGWVYGGEKDDLQLSVENVSWKTFKCPDPNDCEVVTGVKFDLKVEWVITDDPGAFGSFGRYWDGRESEKTTDETDYLSASWSGGGWVLADASLTNPSRVDMDYVVYEGKANVPERPPRLSGSTGAGRVESQEVV